MTTKGFFCCKVINCKSWFKGLLRGKSNAETEVSFAKLLMFNIQFPWNLSVQSKHSEKINYKTIMYIEFSCTRLHGHRFLVASLGLGFAYNRYVFTVNGSGL